MALGALTMRNPKTAVLLAAGWLTAAAGSAPAFAGPLAGNSNGSYFSSLSGCSVPCGITANGGQGVDSRVEWGRTDPLNTLTALDFAFSSATPANDLPIAALRWVNNAADAFGFSVVYHLVLSFSDPAMGSGSLSVPITIEENAGGSADRIGLSVASLAGLSYTLPGVVVSDLKFALDTANSTSGTTFSPGTGAWNMLDPGESTMLITADFTLSGGGGQPVPLPGSLWLAGVGLLALAAQRRRR
jgi:hypothetical protein